METENVAPARELSSLVIKRVTLYVELYQGMKYLDYAQKDVADKLFQILEISDKITRLKEKMDSIEGNKIYNMIVKAEEDAIRDYFN